VPLLYFCSLGPVHVLEHRICRSAETMDGKLRCERFFGAYIRPGLSVISLCPGLKRVAARYVHWWVTVTRTPRPWISMDYWYDDY
jgi:hypothetical protein